MPPTVVTLIRLTLRHLLGDVANLKCSNVTSLAVRVSRCAAQGKPR
jgi:hypothetical protein